MLQPRVDKAKQNFSKFCSFQELWISPGQSLSIDTTGTVAPVLLITPFFPPRLPCLKKNAVLS